MLALALAKLSNLNQISIYIFYSNVWSNYIYKRKTIVSPEYVKELVHAVSIDVVALPVFDRRVRFTL